MTEPQGLDLDAVVEMNFDLCAETGEHSVLLDPEGLEAALARPWSGFGEHETFPSIYEKAAAFLHGIAARQVFENGNKRTAWVAAITLLELNGVDIGRVETVQSDMFVRAAALDHSLTISDIAEWFQVAHNRRRVGYGVDARVEYMALAGAAPDDDDSNSGTLSVVNMHAHTFVVPVAPFPLEVWFIMRLHWSPEDVGRTHNLRYDVIQESKVVAPLKRRTKGRTAWGPKLTPVVGGHAHHHEGVIPALVSHCLPLSVIKPGSILITATLDGAVLGQVPARFEVANLDAAWALTPTR